jgi:hypothetical protein
MLDSLRSLIARGKERLSTDALIVWACVYLVLGEGLALNVPLSQESRRFPLASLFTIVLVALVWWKLGGVPGRNEWRRLWPPALYLSLNVLVIVAGVVVGGSWHYLAAVAQPVAIGAWVIAGWLVARTHDRAESSMLSALRWTAFAQLLGGVVQLAGRLLGGRDPMWLWGRYLEGLYHTPILTRASGFYLNPNTYSLLGLLLAVWAMYAPGDRNVRFGVGLSGAVIIVLGASRTSLVVGGLLGVIWLASSSRRLAQILSSRRRKLILLAAAAVLVVIAASTQFGGMLAERVSSIAKVAVSGPSADRNLDARLAGWVQAVEYLRQHPAGTLVPPYAKLKVVDSDYLRCLAQGSVPYLLSFLAVLCSASWMGRGGGRRRLILWVTAGVALTGLFQSSAESVPAMPLFWMLLGMFSLGSQGDSLVSKAPTPSQPGDRALG